MEAPTRRDLELEVDDTAASVLAMCSVSDLRTRLALVTRVIREAQADGDERWRNVVPQQRRINAALVAKIRTTRLGRGEPDAEPVVVGMKPLALATRATRL